MKKYLSILMLCVLLAFSAACSQQLKTGEPPASTEASSPEMAFAIGIIAGLVSLIFRRQIVNFEECYVPLREGTHRRKYIFYLALFLGWSGIDRFLMKRWFLGLIKFLFAFWTINMLIAALTAMPSTAAALGQAFLFSLPFMLYWWTVDTLLIGMGAARERHKSYLR